MHFLFHQFSCETISATGRLLHSFKKIRGCAVAQWLQCWTAKRGVRGSNSGQIWFEISPPSAPLGNLAVMSTLTAHCQWEDETVRERTGHPPSFAEAKKMKSL